jgi:hypothetical protein
MMFPDISTRVKIGKNGQESLTRAGGEGRGVPPNFARNDSREVPIPQAP